MSMQDYVKPWHEYSLKEEIPMTNTTYENYWVELDKACSRIGGNSFDVTRWLVQFSQASINSLSQGELLNLRYEISAMTFFRFSPRDDLWIPFGAGNSLKDWQGRLTGTSPPEEIASLLKNKLYRMCKGHPSLEQIKELQQFVGGILSSLLNKNQVTLEIPSVQVHAFPDRLSDDVYIVTIGDNPEVLFIYNITWMLIYFGHRIRQCPMCNLIFLADRKNKTFCSSRCQNTYAVRRLRKTKTRSTGKQDEFISPHRKSNSPRNRKGRK